MGLADKMRSIQKIMEVIEAAAPRNHDGEMMSPYCQWAKELRRDIDKGQQWLEATSPEGGGG